MLRLGNDIVDLFLPEAKRKYLDERFLQRVFTLKEQETIKESVNKARTFWSIWAAKEAAFKACQKIFPNLVFGHRKFEVVEHTLSSINTSRLGSVDEGLQASVDSMVTLQDEDVYEEAFGFLMYDNNQLLSLRWHWFASSVHCIAVLADAPHLVSWQSLRYHIAVINAGADESAQTRQHAKQFLLQQGCDPDIEIIRPMRATATGLRLSYPMVYLHGCELENYEVSLSHDGCFSAVIFCENKFRAA